MRGIGRMIYRMDMELRLGLIVQGMRGSIKMGRNMGGGRTRGVMGLGMWASGSTIR